MLKKAPRYPDKPTCKEKPPEIFQPPVDEVEAECCCPKKLKFKFWDCNVWITNDNAECEEEEEEEDS